MRQPFTVAEGLEVQTHQLKFWQHILKPEAYKILIEEINKIERYRKMKDGYDVLRGTDIDNLVANKLKP